VSEITGPPKRESGGAGIARVLAAGTGFLVQLTSKLFGDLHKRGGAAMADFRARPEHARWRAYALGSYSALVAGTLVAQLYTTNPLDAYVKVTPVEVPNSTMVFVRNDSKKDWKRVKLTLNGIYTFDAPELKPSANILVQVTRFTVTDAATGKSTTAPRTIVPRQLAIDCNRGHLDVELTP
jgi:hypothetical protein